MPKDPTRKSHPDVERAIVPVDPLRQYLAEVHKYPLLSESEEQALARRFRDENDLDAARQLVGAHLRMVVTIAMEYRSAFFNLLDLIQEGNVGIMVALKKFDPERGTRFSYYAAWWVRSYILKYLLDNFRLIRIGTTKGQRKLFYNLIREKQKIEAMGFRPDAHLLARHLGVTADEVVMMSQRLTQPEASLEAPLGHDPKSASLGDFIADDDVPFDEKLAQQEIRDIFAEKLAEFAARLPERDHKILQERLLAEVPRTLQDIAGEYGISKERARQLEARILQKLREHMQKAGIGMQKADGEAPPTSPKGWRKRGKKPNVT